jgi:hypothetical protein
VLTTAKQAPEYTSPPRTSVVTMPSVELGVTNGLLLRMPHVHCVGDRSLLERPRVAIVGSRKASQEGRRRAEQLARDCARAGIVVVSGLAEGIDYAAHTSAIEHGGQTIAVIGTPLDKVYPAKHAALQETIYRDHLLVLVSAFEWGHEFVPSNFPERNRLMARIAHATAIIEATPAARSTRRRRASASGTPSSSRAPWSTTRSCRGRAASSAATSRWGASFDRPGT